MSHETHSERRPHQNSWKPSFNVKDVKCNYDISIMEGTFLYEQNINYSLFFNRIYTLIYKKQTITGLISERITEVVKHQENCKKQN